MKRLVAELAEQRAEAAWLDAEIAKNLSAFGYRLPEEATR